MTKFTVARVTISVVLYLMAFVRTAARPSTVAVAFMATVFVTSLLLLSLVTQSSGHGMMMDPVNRASRWRQNASAPKDFGDNQLWCGGFYVRLFGLRVMVDYGTETMIAWML